MRAIRFVGHIGIIGTRPSLVDVVALFTAGTSWRTAPFPPTIEKHITEDSLPLWSQAEEKVYSQEYWLEPANRAGLETVARRCGSSLCFLIDSCWGAKALVQSPRGKMTAVVPLDKDVFYQIVRDWPRSAQGNKVASLINGLNFDLFNGWGMITFEDERVDPIAVEIKISEQYFDDAKKLMRVVGLARKFGVTGTLKLIIAEEPNGRGLRAKIVLLTGEEENSHEFANVNQCTTSDDWRETLYYLANTFGVLNRVRSETGTHWNREWLYPLGLPAESPPWRLSLRQFFLDRWQEMFEKFLSNGGSIEGWANLEGRLSPPSKSGMKAIGFEGNFHPDDFTIRYFRREGPMRYRYALVTPRYREVDHFRWTRLLRGLPGEFWMPSLEPEVVSWMEYLIGSDSRSVRILGTPEIRPEALNEDLLDFLAFVCSELPAERSVSVRLDGCTTDVVGPVYDIDTRQGPITEDFWKGQLREILGSNDPTREQRWLTWWRSGDRLGAIRRRRALKRKLESKGFEESEGSEDSD